jgi:hypothetical protein
MTADFAALLPTPLRRAPAPGVLAHGPGCAVYGALDGIGALAEALMPGGRAGDDALARALDTLIGACDDVVAQYGGTLAALSDRALAAVFVPAAPRADDRPADDVQRGFACALALQERFKRFLAFEAPVQARGLALRVGVGAGARVELCAAHGAGALLYALHGPALDEALAAHEIARAGEVVAGPDALGLALGAGTPKLRAHFGWIAGEPAPALPASTAPEPAAAADAEALPAALRARLGVAPGPVRAGLVVLQWPRAACTDEELLDFLGAAGALADAHGGWLAEVDLGGQHPRVLAAFLAAHDDPLPRALDCAAALGAAAAAHAWLAGRRIGVAGGRVFAGACGAARRRVYLLAGTPLTEARRLATQAPPGPVWLASPDAEHAQAYIA